MVVWPEIRGSAPAYPPMSQAKWARVESSVILGASGILTHILCRSTWRRPAIPRPCSPHTSTVSPSLWIMEAPLRLLVPVKLGLKNVKAITKLTYVVEEPRDYWADVDIPATTESKTPAYRTAIYGPVHRETI